MIRPQFSAITMTICLTTILTTMAAPGCSKNETDGLPADNVDQTVQQKTNKQHESGDVKGSANATVTYTSIAWTDLLPDNDLKALENPPEYLGDIVDGSEADQLNSQLKTETSASVASSATSSATEDRYQTALVSKNIRPEFDGRDVRIPGFIVPLEFDDEQTITTFFLVPFFGACIHMPPPPPNQILYAEYEPGIQLDALYDPFWINGTLSTALVENDMATAAYSIDVSTIEPYVETINQQTIDQQSSEPGQP